MVPDLMLVLHLCQSVEQALPLGVVGVGVRNANVLEEISNLSAAQATFRISQNTTCSF
jgi:hypothetical protein